MMIFYLLNKNFGLQINICYIYIKELWPLIHNSESPPNFVRSFHLSLADTYPNLIKIRYLGQTSPALRICKSSASSYTSHSCSIVDLHVSFSVWMLIYSLSHWQLITLFPGMVLIQLLFLTNREEKWLLGLRLAAVIVVLILFLTFFFKLRQSSSKSGGHNNSICIQLPSVNTDEDFESASV